jgi:hypothetical protein
MQREAVTAVGAMREPREPQFKYRAFLSYRAVDARQAEWLHRKLEAYVVPRSLVGTSGDYGVIPRRLGRIFRDRDEARSAEHIERVIAEGCLNHSTSSFCVRRTPSSLGRGFTGDCAVSGTAT